MAVRCLVIKIGQFCTNTADEPECHVFEDGNFSTERKKGFVCIVSGSFFPEHQRGVTVELEQTQDNSQHHNNSAV